MYEAIVFLPLLGAIIAGLIALVGARSRAIPAGAAAGADDHGASPLAPRRTRRISGTMRDMSASPRRAPQPPAPARGGRADHHDAARSSPGPVLVRLRRGRLRRARRSRADRSMDHVRRPQGRLGAAHRHADRRDAGGRDDGIGARSPLFDRLHGRRSAQAALLRLPVVLHLRHADAGDGRQSRADVLRLGRRRPRKLSADRLLVPQARRPMPRRSRRSSSTASATSASRSASSPSSC